MTAALAMALLCGLAYSQQTPPAAPSATPPASNTTVPVVLAPAPQRISLDHVVAVVNGDIILQSDLDAERRFAVFQPFREQTVASDAELIDRLIDRDLIEQQMRLQAEPPIPDAEVDAQLATLRKNIPQCATYHCETDAGWEKFAAEQGFTVDELHERWRVRMEVLRFIEERFRMGIRILPADIDDYYTKILAPAYQKQNATPPAEATVTDRVQEILLQQRVNQLMDDWLKTLRAQGSVQIMQPWEATP